MEGHQELPSCGQCNYRTSDASAKCRGCNKTYHRRCLIKLADAGYNRNNNTVVSIKRCLPCALRYQKVQAIVRLKIDEVTRKAVGITNVLMNELDALLYEATNNGQYAILKKICSISNSKVYWLIFLIAMLDFWFLNGELMVVSKQTKLSMFMFQEFIEVNTHQLAQFASIEWALILELWSSPQYQKL